MELAALAYVIILGYALVWNRGANRTPMPKPPSEPCSPSLQSDLVPQKLPERKPQVLAEYERVRRTLTTTAR